MAFSIDFQTSVFLCRRSEKKSKKKAPQRKLRYFSSFSFPPWERGVLFDTTFDQSDQCISKQNDLLRNRSNFIHQLRHEVASSLPPPTSHSNDVDEIRWKPDSEHLEEFNSNKLPLVKHWPVYQIRNNNWVKRKSKRLKKSNTFHTYEPSETFNSELFCYAESPIYIPKRQRRIKRNQLRERMDRLKTSIICKELADLVGEQLTIVLNREDLNADYVANISDNFEIIRDAAQSMVAKLVTVEENLAPKFDFDETCRANGFWSLCRVCKLCLTRLHELVNYVTSYHYQSTLLKTKNPLRDLQAYAQCLSALDKALEFVVSNEKLFLESNNLIISLENHPQELIEKLYDGFEELPRAPFYGRTIGFQYDPSLVNPLLAIVVSELSYAELYESNGFARKATAFLSGGKFYLNNKLRGYSMETLSRLCDMSFGKSFWSLTELNMIQHVPSLVCNSVEVNKVIELERTTLFVIPPAITSGKLYEPVEVPYPHTSDSKAENSPPFFMRLISYLSREGMISNDTSVVQSGTSQSAVASQGILQGYPIPSAATLANPLGAISTSVTNQATSGLSSATKHLKKKNPNIAPPSDAIVIHCHGGGFVSQSSRSHEIYLRSWAKFLNVPIVAIDYSLAPEHPFPTAVDECFYCYCWVLNNLEKLGCKKSAKICLVGDSAGGNLVLAIALRCIQTYIRKPDGVVAIYPAVFPQYALSPSRILSVMDCLLAVGILDQCLLAYLGESDPLPPFKLSRVLEHYQGEWEYRLSEPTASGAGSGLAMLPTLACGSWLYRLVRKPNSEAHRNRRRVAARPKEDEEEAVADQLVGEELIKQYKLEMVENSDWVSISRCNSESSQIYEAAEAVKIITSDDNDCDDAETSECQHDQIPRHLLVPSSLHAHSGERGNDAGLNISGTTSDSASPVESKISTPVSPNIGDCLTDSGGFVMLKGDERPAEFLQVPNEPIESQSHQKGGATKSSKSSNPRKGSSDGSSSGSLGFTGRANAARKQLGSSLKMMSRFHHGRAKSSLTYDTVDNSTSKQLQAENQIAICKDSEISKSLRSLTKSSSLPSLESHQTLTTDEEYERVNSKDDSANSTAANKHGAKSSSSYTWGKFGQIFLSPASAVSIDNSPQEPPQTKSSKPIQKQPQATPVQSPTSAASSDVKNQQFLLFEEELKQLRAKKKEAILNTISSPHIKNPLHCPLIATDEELKELPPVSILCGAMDPLLDESVVFAKRLKKLNKHVTFDVLESLPHGFLNFVLVSKLCRDASDLCQKRISDMLIQSSSQNSTDLNLSDLFDLSNLTSVPRSTYTTESGKFETAV